MLKTIKLNRQNISKLNFCRFKLLNRNSYNRLKAF